MRFAQAPLLGMVFGDTNSTCAMWEPSGGGVDMVTNTRGGRVTATCALYHAAERTKPPTVFVGEDALNRDLRQPGGLFRGMKAYVGVSPQEVELPGDKSLRPDQTDTKIMVRVRVGVAEQDLPVDRIVSVMAEAFLSRAKLTLGDAKISQAVVAVPPFYTSQQRSTVSRCLAVAGLESVTVSEPLAALVGASLHMKHDQKILVFDLGGTSSIVSLTQIDSKGCLELLSVHGDASLGGAAIDRKVLAEIDAEYEKISGGKMPEKHRRRLYEKVEQIKKSGKGDVDVELPDSCEECEFEYSLTPLKLQGFSEDIMKTCLSAAKACLGDAAAQKDEIETILLVGGGSRLAGLKSAVQTAFPDSDVILGGGVPPEEAISIGAASIGSFLTQPTSAELTPDSFHHLDLTSPTPNTIRLPVISEKLTEPIAIATHGDPPSSDLLFPPNTQLPASACHHFSCRSRTGVVTLVTPPGNNALGSLVFDVPGYPVDAGFAGPNLSVKVSVSVEGCAEVVVIGLNVDKTVMLRTGRLGPPCGAQPPPQAQAAAQAQPQQQAQPQKQAQPQPQPEAAAPPPARTVDQLLDDLNDRVQAIMWFCESALKHTYPIPPQQGPALTAAVEAADKLLQAPPSDPTPIQAALSTLTTASEFKVGAESNFTFMRIAFGTWLYAVAPQDDDTNLLKEGFSQGVPTNHLLSGNGNTLLHEIGTYGAVNCFEALLSAAGVAEVKQGLALRNQQELTPIETAAVKGHQEVANKMAAVVQQD